MSYLIGCDIGTLSTKSILASTEGQIIAVSSIDYEIVTPKPLWADFPMEKPLQAVYETIKTVIKKAKIEPKNIVGICISGLYGGTGVPVDKNFKIIRPAIPWLDKRATAECKWIEESIGSEAIAAITGNCIDTYWGFTKMEWLRFNEPKNWEKIHQLFTPNAYVIFKLTGNVSLDYSSAGNYGGIFDIHQFTYAEPLMEELQIPRSFFPEEIVKSCAIVGEITAEGEKLTGLKKGTPISAGGIDAPVEALSVGTLNIGEHTATLGTSMCWNIVQDRDTAKIDPSLINYPYVANDEKSIYSFGGATTAAGIITWFRDNLAQGEVIKAKNNPELSAYQLLDDLASQVPPGSNGLITLPYFMGERTPIWDPYARGTIVGLTLYHTRAHLFRSFLEGVAFSLKDNIQAALKIGVQLDEEMTLIGGGAKSTLWRQIFADITGFKIKYLSQSVGAPLGDALLAGVGNQLFDYNEIKNWSQIESISEPNPKTEKIYDELFKIYQEIYNSNKKIYPNLPK